VQSWYFDLSGVEKYWGKERTYHHTAPITMIYALHEGLSIVKEEGLENRWAHHARCMSALRAGLDALGLHSLPAPEYQMASLAVVRLPEGVDDVRLRSRLLSRFNIEIAGGLGPLKGKILRIGLMGTSCSEGNALLLLSALEILLAEDGYLKATGRGAGAAQAVLAQTVVPQMAGAK
jgi:alanine-glyoxylate transaminase/serine-glyoxylate transaminase/serine-pyruvate transaminase